MRGRWFHDDGAGTTRALDLLDGDRFVYALRDDNGQGEWTGRFVRDDDVLRLQAEHVEGVVWSPEPYGSGQADSSVFTFAILAGPVRPDELLLLLLPEGAR